MDSGVIFSLVLAVLFFTFVIWLIIHSRRQRDRDDRNRSGKEDAVKGSTLPLLMFLESAEGPQMTTGGWIFLIGAWTAILLLVIFAFSKVLSNRR
ncbi:MAG TPA: hypothetical protein VNO70_07100 [Blastocatellia bacterium]|nr:hypothetical protein [Blastocatellia bacterium]